MKKLYVFTKNGIRETTDYKTKKDCKHEFEANEIEVIKILTQDQMKDVEKFGTTLTKKQKVAVEKFQSEGLSLQTAVELAKESKYL